MQSITFDSLPEAVNQLNEKIDRLIELQEGGSSQPDHDRFMDVDQLIEYLPDNPSRSSVYRWVTYRKIPFHKEGKKLLFRRSEIDKWLENGRSMVDLNLEK